MSHRHRILVTACYLTALLTIASPAATQPSDLPTGESYHMEILGGLWTPTPEISIASDAFGISGTDIDFVNDLGIGSERFGELRLRLRPGRKHRFRIDYLPISYSTQAVLKRRLVFRGIAYDIGKQVSSAFSWTAWRLGYEYDVVHRSHGYFGVIIEAKYTDVEASLATPDGREFTRARGPIPAIGAVLRISPVPFLSVTAEVSGIRLPSNLLENYSGEYVDVDVYGTLNFIKQFGIQVGYRSLDLNVSSDQESGAFKLEGLYMGTLLRF
jgi:hypothetical protein